jgi:hypothetical protein
VNKGKVAADVVAEAEAAEARAVVEDVAMART